MSVGRTFSSPSCQGVGRDPAADLDVVTDARAGAGLTSEFLAPSAAPAPGGTNKRKRRPAGTPDPDADVVALSPKTLMESDRYICEICNQGFQRDQNLQMHRRRHKVPWKLLKRPSLATTKRVYICPERSCLHHDPAHALGDLVGIKKHYRRKHCTEKQWKCEKCSKGYAVQSDYKAHLKTCGTRGHCCNCGRVFSRVESFIEHQDTCSAVRRKNVQQSGGVITSEGVIFPYSVTDTRNSNESDPSQSSDTTQAMSADHTASRRNVVSDHVLSTNSGCTNLASLILDEHARRLQSESCQSATPSSTPTDMPAWLAVTDLRSNKSFPAACQAHSGDNDLVAKAEMIRTEIPVDDHDVYRSSARSRPSSNISAAFLRLGTSSEVKMNPTIVEPSLHLSIGPAPNPEADLASSCPSPFTDIKPSFYSSSTVLSDREAFALNSSYHGAKSSRSPNAVGSKPVSYQSKFQMTAQLSAVDSSAGFDVHEYDQSAKPKHDNVRRSDQVMPYYNPSACGGISESLHRGNWAESSVVRESDHPPATRLGSEPQAASRRGIMQNIAQLAEPATSSVEILTSRQASLQHLDNIVAEVTDRQRQHLGEGASSKTSMSKDQLASFISHNLQDMAAAPRAITSAVLTSQVEQQDMKVFVPARCWSDLLASWNMRRFTTDEARRECELEAERELARAEMLKREAREQLQCAAAEKAYSERARDAAKRQIEISEGELETAKRLRGHAQSELQKAIASPHSPVCRSCKSAIETSTITGAGHDDILPRRPSMIKSSTSPSNSRSLITAPLRPAPPDPLDATFTNLGSRVSWSESIDNFERATSWHSKGSHNVMRNGNVSIGMKFGPPDSGVESPQIVAAQLVSSTLELSKSRRDGSIAPPDLDLN